jgi:hypothetical protein
MLAPGAVFGQENESLGGVVDSRSRQRRAQRGVELDRDAGSVARRRRQAPPDAPVEHVDIDAATPVIPDGSNTPASDRGRRCVHRHDRAASRSWFARNGRRCEAQVSSAPDSSTMSTASRMIDG